MRSVFDRYVHRGNAGLRFLMQRGTFQGAVDSFDQMGDGGCPPMNTSDRFLKFAAECQVMAKFSPSSENKAVWRGLAQRWIRCAELMDPPRFRGRQPALTETPSKSSALRPAYQPSSSRLPRELLNLSVLPSGLTDVHHSRKRSRRGIAPATLPTLLFISSSS